MNTQIIRPPAFQRPSGYMYADVQQTVNSDVNTKVAFNKVLSNFSDGIEDVSNDRIVVGKAGVYSVFGQVCIEDFEVVANKLYSISVRLSGSGVYPLHKYNQTAFADHYKIDISGLVYLSAVDYMELYFKHNTGAAIFISCAVSIGADTYFSVQRVR
jgi:hypothetical protein